MKTKQMSTRQRWMLLAACIVFGLLLPATFLLPESEPAAEPVEAAAPDSGATATVEQARLAEDTSSRADQLRKPLDDSPGYGAMLLKTVLSLAVVCLLAFAALKWGLGRLYGANQRDDRMSVVSRMRLGPKREVLVARVGPRHLILGSTDQQLSVLGELSESEAREYFTEQNPGEAHDG